MKVLITQWALDAYLDLKHENAFTQMEFMNKIKPDVFLLKHYPNSTKFRNDKFWSIASDVTGDVIPRGYKMKWHQIGNGKTQLRLPIAIMNEIFLCEAYVKMNSNCEKRKLAKFKVHIQLIEQGRHSICGEL